MHISQIEIGNVKGIQHYVLNQKIYPNQPNILVAPNGFGKSSFALAFKKIERHGIHLSEDDLYQGNIANLPFLKLQFSDGKILEADSNSTNILDSFAVIVANNPIQATATAQHYGKRTIAHPKLSIETTTIIDNIPSKKII